MNADRQEAAGGGYGSSPPRRWKIAIAGVGAAAREIHLPAYAKISELEIVGGCDPAMSPSDFNFPLFSSLDAMLEKTRPDILGVAAPTDFHYELTRKGLLTGCHVLCEKPFMSTLEEADELVALSRKLNRWVVVNNQYRFMNIHRAVKELIGTPEFGELLYLTAQAPCNAEDNRRTLALMLAAYESHARKTAIEMLY